MVTFCKLRIYDFKSFGKVWKKTVNYKPVKECKSIPQKYCESVPKAIHSSKPEKKCEKIHKQRCHEVPQQGQKHFEKELSLCHILKFSNTLSLQPA